MEGGIGLTDSRSARQRWMVAGHEVAALSEDFENAHYLMERRDECKMEDFCQHQNQAWPPALFYGVRLPLATKSDILTCLDNLFQSQTKTSDAICVVLDGAAFI